MRVKSKELIPGEPEDEKQLREMIDAPLGKEREGWKPKWPPLKKTHGPHWKGQSDSGGEDLTVVSFGRSLHLCRKALKSCKYSAELIDLRSLYPYDWQMIKASYEKTNRILFVNEDTEVANFGEHLSFRAVKEGFYHLLAPPSVLAGRQVPGIGLNQIWSAPPSPRRRTSCAKSAGLWRPNGNLPRPGPLRPGPRREKALTALSFMTF